MEGSWEDGKFWEDELVENKETDPKIPITPIKRAAKYQKEAEIKSVSEDINTQAFKTFDLTLNGREFQLIYDRDTGNIILDGKIYKTKVEDLSGLYRTSVNGEHNYTIEYHEGQIFLEGRLIDFDFKPAIPKLIRKKAHGVNEELLTAPLPGHVIGIAVSKGDAVKAGQKVLTLEAMKMQNEILCRTSGIVKDIYVKVGAQVSTNDRLVLIAGKKE